MQPFSAEDAIELEHWTATVTGKVGILTWVGYGYIRRYIYDPALPHGYLVSSGIHNPKAIDTQAFKHTVKGA